MLIYFLIFLNLVLPLIVIKKKCIFNQKLEINHILLFSVGFLFYMVIPIIVGVTGIFRDYVGMGLWYAIFNGIRNTTLYIYLIAILIFYFCFTYSNEIITLIFNIPLIKNCRKKINNKKLISNNGNFKNINKNYLYIFLAIFSLISIYYIYRFQNILFKGYTNSVSYSLQKGPFVAVSIMIFSIASFYTLILKKQDNKITFLKAINNYFFYILLIISILIASLGGRLYFLSSIMMLLVMRSILFKKFDIKKASIIFFILALAMGGIGVIRLGGARIDIKSVVFNIFQETLYTAYSLISFLKAGRLGVLHFPIFISSEIINLIPSFILPDKLLYILKPTNFGYSIYSPQGATNVFVTAVVNFGIIGSFIFFIVFGKIFTYLKKKNNILTNTIYIMFSGFLIFSFYRDDSANSLMKNFFEFSFLIPMMIYYFCYYLDKFRKEVSKK